MTGIRYDGEIVKKHGLGGREKNLRGLLIRASLVAQMLKNLPAMRETWI